MTAILWAVCMKCEKLPSGKCKELPSDCIMVNSKSNVIFESLVEACTVVLYISSQDGTGARMFYLTPVPSWPSFSNDYTGMCTQYMMLHVI